MTRRLRIWLRRFRLPSLALALAGCSSEPDEPSYCIDDSVWIINWECVEMCAAPGYKFGACDYPDEQTQCVKLWRGDVIGVVRRSGMSESTDGDFEATRCEP
jgi:hypothetical protein